MSACWPLQMPPSPKAVLISLADNANDAGVCWPSIPKICERTCLGRTAVINAIKWLEEVGLLTADRSNGRHTTYQIELSALKQGALFEDAKPVREANRSGRRTGPAGVPNQSARRTAPVRQADSNRQEPSGTRETESARAAPDPVEAPTDAGRACLLMRAAGCSQTNPSHPDLLAALAEGVTPDVLGHTAAEAVEGGIARPFAWAITTARNRHARGAAALAAAPSASGASHETHRRLSAVERVRANVEAAERRDAESAGGQPIAHLVAEDG